MWKLLAFGAAWLALVASGRADEVTFPGCDSRGCWVANARATSEYPVYSSKHPTGALLEVSDRGGKLIAKLDGCGSIKGPFTIYGPDGAIIFVLQDGQSIGPMDVCK